MKLRDKQEVIGALKEALSGGMSTLSAVPWGTSMLDHRDLNRLIEYLSYEEAKDVFGEGLVAENGDGWGEVRPWTVEEVKGHMRGSLEFAFEKANNQRGISANLMFYVMRMFLWMVEDEELGDENYYDYGLSFLYQIRDKYFPEMEVR